MQNQEHLLYRFGPYELDEKLLELRKDGGPVKLREQACRILLFLLERPGELVTREELRQRLWSDDTFVNFDKSLNTAVNTLREVLCDSATEPCYVQTVPRQGYRFIARVEANSRAQRAAAESVVTLPTLALTRSPRRFRVWALAALFIVLVAGGSIWVGRRLFSRGSKPAQLRAMPIAAYTGRIRSPSLSPDGSQVAFSWHREGATDADIYVQTVGGPEPLRLTDSPLDEFGPAWSPDGSAIAFSRAICASIFEVMLVAPSGGEPRKLAQIYYPLGDLGYQSELLAWTPDGKSLLFPDAGQGERTAIWSVDVHTGARAQLTNPQSPVLGHSLPKVRNDGRVLVYQQVGGPYFFSLGMVGLSEEGKPTGKTMLITHGYNIAPIGWIGNDLVFSSRSHEPTFFNRWSPSGTISKFEIPDIDGMSARIGSVSGSITRDGRRMAIGTFRWGVHIWKADISPDGTAEHAKKLLASTFRDLNPDYSPDGRRIVFKSTRSGGDEVWIATADGTRLRQLTHLGGVGYPRWSPDGARILFNGGPVPSRGNLFTADVETGDLHQITNGKSNDENGRWSHDGRWIYFDSDRTGRSEIWKVSSNGGPEIQVTKTGGETPMETLDGKYLYYGKEESRHESHVWRMSFASGAEERLFPSQIDTESLAMAKRHLYFVGIPPSNTSAIGTTIYSYDLSTGHTCKVVEAGIGIGSIGPSPDEKHLLYAVVDSAGGDLLIVDGFQR